MASMQISQLSRGQALVENGQIFIIVKMEHVKPGKGPAYQQTKLKNIETGKIIEKRYRAVETVEAVNVDKQACTYSYRNGDTFVFMNSETYEELEVQVELLGDDALYLLEGESVRVMVAQGRILGVDIPPAVDLVITECDPGVKNATATNVFKNAIVETGLTVAVPPFINIGDKVRIDTESGKYLERVATA